MSSPDEWLAVSESWSVFSLWKPILASGFATYFASFLAWTVLPHHKGEMKGLGEKEDELMDWIPSSELPPGEYVFPYCSDMKDAQNEEFQQKQQKCTGQLILWKKPLNMAAAMVKTLAFFLFAAFMIGYVTAYAFPPHASGYADKDVVFRFVFAVGVMTHCFAIFPHVFWFERKYVMSLLDGVVFALLTSGIFYALWPTHVLIKSFE